MAMGLDTFRAMAMPASTCPALLHPMRQQTRYRKLPPCTRSWPLLPSGVTFACSLHYCADLDPCADIPAIYGRHLKDEVSLLACLFSDGPHPRQQHPGGQAAHGPAPTGPDAAQ